MGQKGSLGCCREQEAEIHRSVEDQPALDGMAVQHHRSMSEIVRNGQLGVHNLRLRLGQLDIMALRGPVDIHLHKALLDGIAVGINKRCTLRTGLIRDLEREDAVFFIFRPDGKRAIRHLHPVPQERLLRHHD